MSQPATEGSDKQRRKLDHVGVTPSGQHYQAEAIFFRREDGTPWVRFSEDGSSLSLAPVVEVGKVLRWSGLEEHLGNGTSSFTYLAEARRSQAPKPPHHRASQP